VTLTSRTDYCFYRTKNTPANGVPVDGIHGNNVSLDDLRVGDKNPHWKVDVKNHVNAATKYDRTVEKVTYDSMNVWAEWGNGVPRYNLDQYYDGPGVAPLLPASGGSGSAIIAKLTKQASIKLILKARQAQQKLQASVALGEFGETLRMIRNPGKAFFESIVDFSRRARRRVRKIKGEKFKNRAIQDMWLETRFGWLPLASDIEGAYEALKNIPDFSYSKVRASSPVVTSNGFVPDTSVVVGKFVFRRMKEVRNTASVKAYGEVKIAPNNKAGYLERFGISTSEFLPTVWELIPYSFLVDYFTNIGDVIAAGTYPMSNFAWSGLTIKDEKQNVYRFSLNQAGTAANYAGQGFHACGGGDWSTTGWRTTISRHTSIDDVSLSLSNISFEIPGLGLKWLNMAALAGSRRVVSTTYY
jgi:hypothetical protein